MAGVVCRVFKLLSALSLLLSVVAMAACVRSYFVVDEITRYSSVAEGEGMRISDCQLLLGRGRLFILPLSGKFKTVKGSCRTPGKTVHWQRRKPGARAWLLGGGNRSGLSRWGFYYEVEHDVRSYGTFTTRHALVPLWGVGFLSAMPPALWAHKRFRRRADLGRCTNCGYDLRATPGRCPECGTVPVNAKGKA